MTDRTITNYENENNNFSKKKRITNFKETD